MSTVEESVGCTLGVPVYEMCTEEVRVDCMMGVVIGAGSTVGVLEDFPLDSQPREKMLEKMLETTVLLSRTLFGFSWRF